MRRWLAMATLLLFLPTTANAQVPVVDPLNIAQAVLIVERTLAQWVTQLEQLSRIIQMSQRLGGDMNRYRTPPILPAAHDVGRYPYAAPLLQGLNSGDARGELYRRVVGVLPVITQALERVSPDGRRLLRQYYADLETLDSVAERAIHHVGQMRGYGSELDRAIAAFEMDVVHPSTSRHFMTAILDKISGGALIQARQDVATNQELSHVLENLILKTKATRDAETMLMDMRIKALTVDRRESVAVGSEDALRNWRQP